MYILDTDSLSILEHSGANAQRLLAKLSTLQAEELAVTIITYEEQMRGWLSYIAKAKSIQAKFDQVGVSPIKFILVQNFRYVIN